MVSVREHYDQRLSTSERLQRLLREGKKAADFSQIALGISDKHGNYSAHEHGLGPRILERSTPERVLRLAHSLSHADSPERMVRIVYEARIAYLKISVGSEIAMMLRPDSFWVANTRTLWAHLLVERDCNVRKANEELTLYRSQEKSSEVDYRIWRELYLHIKCNLNYLGEEGGRIATERGVQIGERRNLWSDTIANALYEEFASYARVGILVILKNVNDPLRLACGG